MVPDVFSGGKPLRDAEKTTIVFSMPAGVDRITSADAATYAQLVAKLCTDIFTGGG